MNSLHFGMVITSSQWASTSESPSVAMAITGDLRARHSCMLAMVLSPSLSITRSSGAAALDQAAGQIVHLAEPFAYVPAPVELEIDFY